MKRYCFIHFYLLVNNMNSTSRLDVPGLISKLPIEVSGKLPLGLTKPRKPCVSIFRDPSENISECASRITVRPLSHFQHFGSTHRIWYSQRMQ